MRIDFKGIHLTYDDKIAIIALSISITIIISIELGIRYIVDKIMFDLILSIIMLVCGIGSMLGVKKYLIKREKEDEI